MTKLRDLDSMDEMLDEHFSNDRYIKTGLNNYYKAQDPAYREKLSKANKGKILTEETKNKISNSRIGLKIKPHSEETKNKIGNAHRNKIVSTETRQKISEARLNSDNINLKKALRESNGKKVSTPAGIFETRSDAAQHYNIPPSTMSYWCKNKNKPEFYFVEEEL